MVRRGLVLLVALSFAGSVGVGGGCRSCDETTRATTSDAGFVEAAAGPTMPVGLLVPQHPDADASLPVKSPSERLTIVRQLDDPTNNGVGQVTFHRGIKIVDPSNQEDGGDRFLPLDAMTLLHDAFARALLGFDLLRPRKFEGDSLSRLKTELTTLRAEVGAMKSVRVAKARWAERSSLIRDLPDNDSEWLPAQRALAASLDDLVAFTTALEKKDQSLWVQAF